MGINAQCRNAVQMGAKVSACLMISTAVVAGRHLRRRTHSVAGKGSVCKMSVRLLLIIWHLLVFLVLLNDEANWRMQANMAQEDCEQALTRCKAAQFFF